MATTYRVDDVRVVAVRRGEGGDVVIGDRVPTPVLVPPFVMGDPTLPLPFVSLTQPQIVDAIESPSIVAMARTMRHVAAEVLHLRDQRDSLQASNTALLTRARTSESDVRRLLDVLPDDVFAASSERDRLRASLDAARAEIAAWKDATASSNPAGIGAVMASLERVLDMRSGEGLVNAAKRMVATCRDSQVNAALWRGELDHAYANNAAADAVIADLRKATACPDDVDITCHVLNERDRLSADARRADDVLAAVRDAAVCPDGANLITHVACIASAKSIADVTWKILNDVRDAAGCPKEANIVRHCRELAARCHNARANADMGDDILRDVRRVTSCPDGTSIVEHARAMFAAACGASEWSRTLASVKTASACPDTTGITLHVHRLRQHAERPGVGVGVLVRRADGALLMGRRKGSHGAGTWSVPGGHVERGEEPIDACQRELSEEAGYDIHTGALTMLPRYTFTTMQHRAYVTLYATTTVPMTTALPPPCREFSEWRWVRADNVPAPLFGPLLRLVESGYNPWRSASVGGARCASADVRALRDWIVANSADVRRAGPTESVAAIALRWLRRGHAIEQAAARFVGAGGTGTYEDLRRSLRGDVDAKPATAATYPAYMCSHANEVPAVCPCPPDDGCYCHEHSCRVR